MRVAVLSDIHGNRHALEAVLGEVASSDVDDLWCLGDVVGYGADPNDCTMLVMAHAPRCLAGNHDLAVTGVLPLDEFSHGAGIAARWTRDVLTPEHAGFLRSLAPEGTAGPVGLYHASPRDPVWEYVLSALLAEMCFDVMRPRVGLVGHSHVALAFWRPEGEAATGAKRRAGDRDDLSRGEWLLNPGSVGQPRDGDPRAAWLLLDTDAWTAEFRRTAYDIGGAKAAIRAARLPESLAERLEYGQ